jgi:hypothetical protein
MAVRRGFGFIAAGPFDRWTNAGAESSATGRTIVR